MKSGSAANTLISRIPSLIFGMPVERDIIFSNHKGTYHRRIEKRQRRLIAKTTFIKFFLHHNERIWCLTTGCSPFGRLGKLLTIFSLIYFRHAILLFTDKRLLLIPTSFKLRPHSSVSQIMYADCAGMKLKRRSLLIDYKSGLQEVLPHLSRKERKKIRSLIERLPLKPKEAGGLRKRVHLCPSCANMLKPGPAPCPKCSLAFKTDRQAATRALLIPGGGYFYSRHPMPGVIIGVLEILLAAGCASYFADFGLNLFMRLDILLASGASLMLVKLIALAHSRILISDHMPTRRDFTLRKI